MTGLTLRVEGGRVIASDDEGRTAYLEGGLAETLRAAWDRANPPTTGFHPTAAALGSIAEARAIRPQDSRDAPPWRSSLEGPRVALGPFVSSASRTLAQLLAERRSQRRWCPVTLSQVATILTRAARVIGWRETVDGNITSLRPVPSAGARHPLDLHLLASDVDGLKPGTYVFDALTCELIFIDNSADRLLADLGRIVGVDASPPAGIAAVAHVERTLSRYPSGLSLVWRDAGVLLGTLHLCCTDLGLASCIVGSCAVLRDERSPFVVDVGALLFGAQPDGRAL